MHCHIATTEARPLVAYLREIMTMTDGRKALHQSQITEQIAYETFDEFAGDFLSRCAYPSPQSHKFESYSWTPTGFSEGEYRPRSRPDAEPKFGLYRTGDACCGTLTVGYLDLDNQHDDRPMVTLDDVAATMETLGLKHLLYTSFSHLKKDGRHKVRIVFPLSRDTDYDGAFLIYVWFNHLFQYQLDGSIYDPGDHLYGPTFGGEIRTSLTGASLDVDAILAAVETLPDEALEFAQRSETSARERRAMTPDEIADYKRKIADTTVQTGVGISNPDLFNPAWLDDVDALYVGGSHRQTLYGIMKRVWLKTEGELSLGDMATIQAEIDLRWGGYCRRNYGGATLKEDLKSIMASPVSPKTPSRAELHQARLEANLRRISRRK